MTREEYIEKRNRLIGKATKKADGSCGVGKKFFKGPGNWAEKWNQEYHAEMNRLAKESGLTK